MSKWWVRTSVVVLACLTLTACGEDVTVRDAEPGPEKATVVIPKGGVVNPRNWPDACSFISDAEIKAILPQAEKIKRTSDWVKLSADDAFGGKAGAGLAPNGECDYSFTLPSNGKHKYIDKGSGEFSVRIVAVGEPELLSRNFSRAKAESGESAVVTEVNARSFGADECFDWMISKDGPLFTACRRGPLMFESIGARFGYIDFANADESSAAYKKVIDKRLTPAFFRAVTANF